jgi:hypothetical protein
VQNGLLQFIIEWRNGCTVEITSFVFRQFYFVQIHTMKKTYQMDQVDARSCTPSFHFFAPHPIAEALREWGTPSLSSSSSSPSSLLVLAPPDRTLL